MKELANKIHDAFDSIQADERLKESTKRFLSERAENPGAVRPPAFRKIAAACSVMAVLALGIAGYSWIQAPVSYVSIDVNPSLEIGLNRFDRVVSAEAYNEEGGAVLDKLSLTGKTCTEAMDAIVKSEEMGVYLTGEAELVFTTAADSGRSLGLQSEVERFCGGTGYNCHSYSTDTGIVSEAHDNGLSVGRYYAYLQLSQYDDTVTVNSCRGMSVSHMHELAEEHGNHGNQDQNHGGNQGQGYGGNQNHGGDQGQNQGQSYGGSQGGNEENGASGGGRHHRGGHHE